MRRIPILIWVLILLVFKMNAQEKHQQPHNSEKKTIKDPGLELVVSGLGIYAAKEDTLDFATEIHLTYWVSHTWAYGIGYTLIYEDEGRVANEIAGLVSHKPWHFLTLNFGPSISIPDSHNELEVSGYLEGEFNFKISEIHTGPLAGVLVGEEFRFFFGVHLGYDF
ncbi:hypothetical protein [Flagellimonas sp. S3867]|uniref:hypothetical protein n=1 Tax=Flagellimonas sp. S3867 TaxID=2768063 RepID=UPI0016858B84|nr:hypothetical protein [Flagellimonas sp. S3867]